MLSPIIKSKYQLPKEETQMKEIEFFGHNGSYLKNQLRNSGFDMQGDNLLSNSIDAWSMGRSNMSKSKLNETVKSDEFLHSKLYTNT